MRMGSFIIMVSLIAAALVGLTGVVTNDYFFFAAYTVLQSIVLATAWNILGGYAGYVNFGTGAFFAVGGYSVIALHKAFAAPLPVVILVGTILASLLGLGTGYLTLRLRGVFFSIATLALSVVLFSLAVNWQYVGGSRGFSLVVSREMLLGFTKPIYLSYAIIVAVAAISIIVARAIETSTLGRGLAAIRDEEIAAACAGVPTMRLKLLTTAISGGLMGMAGSIHPYFVSYVDPASLFDMSYAVNSLAMPMIGGTSSWAGPLIGAILLSSAQQVATVTISSALNLLLVGVLLIVFVAFAPDGILGMVSKWRRTKASPQSGEPKGPANVSTEKP
jgi:branched-chain amino acid transport system permease protein